MQTTPPEDTTDGPTRTSAATPARGLRSWRALAVAAAVILVAAFIAWPYITVHRLKTAVRDGDIAALADLVEFPTVRQGLKDQLNAAALAEITRDGKGGTDMLAGLGLALAGAFIDKAVDAYVTPAGVARLLADNRLQVQPAGGAGDGADATSAASAQREPFAGATMAYRSFDRFVVSVPRQDGQSGQFVLRRRGLGWKLTDIVVPME